MNEDLKWLAENVHEWPLSQSVGAISKHGNTFKTHLYQFESGQFTLDEWQAARDELSGKPGWDEHNHNFICQNNNGRWFGYDIEPAKNERDQCWTHKDMDFMWQGRRHKLCQGRALGDWRNTLERRSDSEKNQSEWRGPEDGLPPVGMECEYRISDDEWGCATVQHYSKTYVILEQYDGGELVRYKDKIEFRPIRTEEDKAVEEMKSSIAKHDDAPTYYHALYRDGWRKQEQSK